MPARSSAAATSGPARRPSDVAEMVSAMQTAIAAKVDGIAVCLVDAEAFNKPTDDALSIGIPVIGYNADTDRQCPARLRWPEPLSIRLQHRPEVAADGEAGRQGDALHRHPRFAEPAAATRRLHPGDQGRRRSRSPMTRSHLASMQATKSSRIESYYLANKDVVGMFGTGGGDTKACRQDFPEVWPGGAGRHHRRLRPATGDPRGSSTAAT